MVRALTVPTALSPFLPSAHTIRWVCYMGLAIGALFCALIASIECRHHVCGATELSVYFSLSLVFGLAWSLFFFALFATLDSILRLLGSGSTTSWLGVWPKPVGVAVIGWVAHLATLVGLKAFYLAVSPSSSIFPGAWYLGFLPYLWK
jgi:hypothetical protein